METINFSRRELLRAAGTVTLAYPFRGFMEGVLLAADSPSKTQTDNLALRFAKYYKPVHVETKASIPSYDLPLDLDKVANFKAVARTLGLTADEPSLKKNGFVVLPGLGNEDVVEPYKHLHRLGVPLFVTADTLLSDGSGHSYILTTQVKPPVRSTEAVHHGGTRSALTAD